MLAVITATQRGHYATATRTFVGGGEINTLLLVKSKILSDPFFSLAPYDVKYKIQ